MKVSINWLKEFVDFNISPEKLAEKINLSVVEVDEIIDFEKIFKGIFIGEIKEIEKHPNADKLSVAQVNIGKKTIQIIFGNTIKLKVGDKLPIALAPITLPSGLEIKKTSIRGVESEGMIASNKELGLEHLDSSVSFFGKETKFNTSLAEALGVNDVILNLDVLSNRPDLFSHEGVAREISAITDKKFNPVNFKIKEDSNSKIDDYLSVEIKDQKACSRYEARIIKDIKVEESPLWLKNRLQVLGIRPVNNIVDITNYVMMELGQPLHAFDFDKLSSQGKKKIIVRKSFKKEEIITLDGKKRSLSPEVLAVCDARKPISIAGVMGGQDTEVSENTRNIILESANFDWVSIRKSTRVLGLRTEAVIRFEKGLDPNMTDLAIDRASNFIADITGGKIVKGKIDKNFSKETKRIVKLKLNKLKKYSGKEISKERIKNTLNKLSIDVEIKESEINAVIPSFRRDIKEDADLIEEILRISGYDKVPITYPLSENKPSCKNEFFQAEKKVKDILKGLGVTEVYNYSFVGESLIKKFGEVPIEYMKLKNPLRMENSLLRRNLLFSMIETAEFNAKNFVEFSIFELSRVFLKNKSKLPNEDKRVSILVYSKNNSFFKVKGILEAMFSDLGIDNVSFSPTSLKNNYWHPQKTADIIINKKKIGVIGQLHPQVQEKFEFSGGLAISEIDLRQLILNSTEKVFKKFSKMPKVIQDLAIVVEEKTLEKNIRLEISKVSGDLLKEIELFDIYRGKQIESGKKSLAYHITYQAKDRTLTDDEVKSIQFNIINALKKRFNAKIRS